MIDIATVEEYMRAANPIPTLDAVDADELAFAVAAVDTRRAAALQAPAQHPSETATPPAAPPPRRRSVWAFAAAFVLVLVVIGAAALLLRSDDTQVTDEPPPPTTEAETMTELAPVESLIWSRVPHDNETFGFEVLGGETWMGTRLLEIKTVTEGGPGLVAVGQVVEVGGSHDAAVWTSTNGTTWTQVPHDESVFGGDPESWQMASVTTGGPGLVAVGQQMRSLAPDPQRALVWVSPDGVTWSRVAHDETFLYGKMQDATKGGPGLVAVGGQSNASATSFDHAAAWSSPDGVTWTRAVVPDDRGSWTQPAIMNSVTAFGPDLVAVGTHGTSAAVWTSRDGLTWSRVPHDEEVLGGVGIQAMSSVASGGPGLVAVGRDNGAAAVWTSTDGLTWFRVPHDVAVFGNLSPSRLPDGWMMLDVTSTDHGLIAVGSVRSGSRSGDERRRAAVWTSQDGVTWLRVAHDETIFGRGNEEPAHEDPFSGMEISSVTIGGRGVVATGADTLARIPVVWIAVPPE